MKQEFTLFPEFAWTFNFNVGISILSWTKQVSNCPVQGNREGCKREQTEYQSEKSEECEIPLQPCQTGRAHSSRCRQSPPRWWTSGLPGWWTRWLVELQRAFSASGSRPGPPWAGNPDRMAVDQTVSPQLEYLVPFSKLPSRPLSGHTGGGLRLRMGKPNTCPTKNPTLDVFLSAGVICVSPWLAPLSWSVPV